MSGRVYLYGYRMHEIEYPTLPECKPDVRFSKTRLKRSEYNSYRTVLSTNLPMYADVSPPRPDPSHPPSLVAGVVKRFGFQPPIADRAKLKEFGRYVELWMKRNLIPLSGDELPSVEDWLDSTDYGDARRKNLLELWADRDSWVVTSSMLAYIKSFIKDETYPEYKYPRLINSRVDMAKCLIGPVVAAISDQLFSKDWFIKKVPVADRPMVISDKLYCPGAEYIFTDYTAFEAHFVPELMRICQFKLYRYMTKNLACHDQVMKFCFGTLAGRNKCEFKNVTISIDGVRMSGEMDTSLANGFHNLMAFLYLTWKHDPTAKVLGFVEGDDGIFRVEPPSAAPTTDDFASIGLTIKIGTTPELSEASFCGQVYDRDDGIVVTDIVDALSRFGWTNKKYVRCSFKTQLELLRARGFSFAYQYNGCPVLSELGHKILELTKHVTIRQSIIDQMDMWERQRFKDAASAKIHRKPVGLSTRALVEKLYGIGIDVQMEWERSIRAMGNVGPLPFSVADYAPKCWSDYTTKYSHTIFDTNPCWLITDEKEFLTYLVSRAPNAVKFVKSL